MSAGVTVNSGNFKTEVTDSSVPVLVDFWAAWCGPCKMIGPMLDQIAEEYSGRLKLGKVNVDEEAALAEQHGITSIPTLVVYKDGQIVNQHSGALPKREIENLFKTCL
ncbi:MAG: thioredoxin [Spirochaetaceae bacterium]|jgi:thioredoxin 1|nr:thioredoxin [Spirochaetaceae bacterium]